MNSLNLEVCLDAVEQTFEQEAEHIIRGQIAEIGALASVKAEHLGALANAIETGALRGQSEDLISRVRRLQATAIEHDQHLQAMRHGLSRALQRIDRLQSDANVGSYNQNGARVQFSGARGRYESKA
ncbi:MAG: hypothetical protein AAF269_01175 [Pseudomonadota bacterium]